MRSATDLRTDLSFLARLRNWQNEAGGQGCRPKDVDHVALPLPLTGPPPQRAAYYLQRGQRAARYHLGEGWDQS
jgi:hypothetical protein